MSEDNTQLSLDAWEKFVAEVEANPSDPRLKEISTVDAIYPESSRDMQKKLYRIVDLMSTKNIDQAEVIKEKFDELTETEKKLLYSLLKFVILKIRALGKDNDVPKFEAWIEHVMSWMA